MATKSKDSLSERLKTKLAGYYGLDSGMDRVRNKALPFNALEVRDFPSDLQYMWVPAPGGLAPDPHNSPQAANLRASYVQKGWQFYPPDEFASDGESDLPWMSVWENDNGKVRAMDHWLMYADRDIEARRRQENTDDWNERHNRAKENRSEAIEGSKNVSQIVQSERGQTSVLDLLKEGEE